MVSSGTLLLIEVAEAAWSVALGRTLERFKPAGLVFRKLASPDATLEACRESARTLGALPFTAIEAEGDGALGAFFAALPRALTLQPAQAAEAGDLIGRAMAVLGLNLTLAPTLDIAPSALSGVHAGPTSGATEEVLRAGELSPAELARRAEAFVGALSSRHVLCCGRHFPGLPPGKAAAPKRSAIVVDRSLAALWREELVPYRALGDKLAAVEISYVVHRAYDYEFLQPASLSPGVIEGLLRTKLRYRGLALADAPRAARAAGIEMEEAVIRALAAGCDLAVVPGEPRLLEEICQGLARAADSGRLTGVRITEAMARVKIARKSLRRPARQLPAVEYSRLAAAFEEFARRWKDR